MVRNGCYELEKAYGVKRLAMWTFTIPYTDPVTLMLICNQWSNIQRKLLQELGREVQRNGGVFDWVAVSEIQEKRFEKRGEFCPHLHIVAVCRDNPRKSEFYVTASKMREIWERIMKKEVKDAGLDEEKEFSASVDCSPLRKTASGYMAKYMSKGSEVIEKGKEMGYVVPRQWWGAKKSLKDKIKANKRKIPSDLKTAIVQLGTKLIDRGILEYLYPVEIEHDGELRCFGWVGKITARGRTILKV
jgi:hypothetical protein